MSTVIQLKRSETASAIPTAGQIAVGELAVNLADGTLYSKKTDGSIIEIGTTETPVFFSQSVDLGLLDPASATAYDMGAL
jgi:hypothetical protein